MYPSAVAGGEVCCPAGVHGAVIGDAAGRRAAVTEATRQTAAGSQEGDHSTVGKRYSHVCVCVCVCVCVFVCVCVCVCV